MKKLTTKLKEKSYDRIPVCPLSNSSRTEEQRRELSTAITDKVADIFRDLSGKPEFGRFCELVSDPWILKVPLQFKDAMDRINSLLPADDDDPCLLPVRVLNAKPEISSALRFLTAVGSILTLNDSSNSLRIVPKSKFRALLDPFFKSSRVGSIPGVLSREDLCKEWEVRDSVMDERNQILERQDFLVVKKGWVFAPSLFPLLAPPHHMLHSLPLVLEFESTLSYDLISRFFVRVIRLDGTSFSENSPNDPITASEIRRSISRRHFSFYYFFQSAIDAGPRDCCLVQIDTEESRITLKVALLHGNYPDEVLTLSPSLLTCSLSESQVHLRTHSAD